MEALQDKEKNKALKATALMADVQTSIEIANKSYAKNVTFSETALSDMGQSLQNEKEKVASMGDSLQQQEDKMRIANGGLQEKDAHCAELQANIAALQTRLADEQAKRNSKEQEDRQNSGGRQRASNGYVTPVRRPRDDSSESDEPWPKRGGARTEFW